MPLRVNLLAENLAAEDMRRRDPVKRAIVGGILLVIVMLVWSGYLRVKLTIDNRDLNQVLEEMNRNTNDYFQVVAVQQKSDATKSYMDSLNKLSTNRFLAGTLMNSLQHLSVPDIQLTQVQIRQTYVQREAKKGEPGKSPAIPATTIEKTGLTIGLKDFSANPGDGVNKLKNALLNEPYLKTALDAASGVKLTGVSGIQTSAGGKSYELFTLECRFPDIER